jgi:hypothetical protein
MKAYKVVRIKDGRLLSAYVGQGTSFLDQTLETEYFVGVWVKAKYIALYAFADIEAASLFKKNEGIKNLVIYECEYTPSKCKYALRFYLNDHVSTVKEWKEEIMGKYCGVITYSKTVACSRIKLIREVKI